MGHKDTGFRNAHHGHGSDAGITLTSINHPPSGLTPLPINLSFKNVTPETILLTIKYPLQRQ